MCSHVSEIYYGVMAGKIIRGFISDIKFYIQICVANWTILILLCV